MVRVKFEADVHSSALPNINRLGLYISIITAIVTLITFAIEIFTPPLSGPWCEGDCFIYPYNNIASRFPRDYLWMYPAMAVMVLYVILMVCIHQYALPHKKVFSQIGLSIALMAAIILISNYFVQVSVIQPSLIKGETHGIAILSQYNPHGIFIALEEIGFLLANISLFMMIPVFPPSDILNKALRLTWMIGFFLAVFTLVLISLVYGIMREYFFEIAIISIVWLQLIISSIILSRIFKRGIASLKT